MRPEVQKELKTEKRCSRCKRFWKIVARGYVGDSMLVKLKCPSCGNGLMSAPGSLFGPPAKFKELKAHSKKGALDAKKSA
jgi:hypothetical protein